MILQLTTKQQLLVSVANSFAVICDNNDTVYTQEPINKTLKILAN